MLAATPSDRGRLRSCSGYCLLLLRREARGDRQAVSRHYVDSPNTGLHADTFEAEAQALRRQHAADKITISTLENENAQLRAELAKATRLDPNAGLGAIER